MNNLNHKNLNKSKTFVLTTMIIFVAIFASSLINFWMGLNVGKNQASTNAAVSISQDRTLTTTYDEKNKAFEVKDNFGNVANFNYSFEDTYPAGDNDKLSFYKNTLGWSIDCAPGKTGTTWYLGRKYKSGDNSYSYYNNGLPALRSFVPWIQLKFNISFHLVDSNNVVQKNYSIGTVGSYDVPTINYLEFDNINVGNVTTAGGSAYATIYGYKISLTAKSSNTLKFNNVSFERTGDTVSVVFKVSDKYDVICNTLTFNHPKNNLTGQTGTDVYSWYEGDSKLFGTTNKYNVFAGSQIKAENDGENKKYTFRAYINESYPNEEITITIKRLTDGYKIVNQLVTTDAGGTTKYDDAYNGNNEKAEWTLNTDLYINVSYDLIYYDFTLGYEIEGDTSRGTSYTRTFNSTDKYYYWNSIKGTSYTYNYIYNKADSNSRFGMSVGGTKFPTSVDGKEEIKKFFGADYDKLSANGTKSLIDWSYDTTALKDGFEWQYVDGTLAVKYVKITSVSHPSTDVDKFTYSVKTNKNATQSDFEGWFEIKYRNTSINGQEYTIVTYLKGYGAWLPNSGNSTDMLVMPFKPIWVEGELNEDVKIVLTNSKQDVTINGSTKTVKGVVDSRGEQIVGEISYLYGENASQRFPYSYGTAFMGKNDPYTSLFGVKWKNGSFDKTMGNYSRYGFYNYGYEIVGYKIKAEWFGNSFYLFSTGGNSWYTSLNSGSGDYISIERLAEPTYNWSGSECTLKSVTSINFSGLVGKAKSTAIDKYGTSGGLKIYIQPVWQAAKINVNTAEGTKTFMFNDAYDLDSPTAQIEGKSFVYYNVLNDDYNVIASNSRWNYFGVSQYSNQHTSNVFVTRLGSSTVSRSDWNSIKSDCIQVTMSGSGLSGYLNVADSFFYVETGEGGTFFNRTYDIDVYQVEYKDETIYSIDLVPQYVDDEYKVDLEGAEGFVPDETTYTLNNGYNKDIVSLANPKNKYTFWDYFTENVASYNYAEEYTNKLKAAVLEYLKAVGVDGKNVMAQDRINGFGAVNTANESSFTTSCSNTDGLVYTQTCVSTNTNQNSVGPYHGLNQKLRANATYRWSVAVRLLNKDSMTINIGHEQGGTKDCLVTREWQVFTYVFTATSAGNSSFHFFSPEFSVGDRFEYKWMSLERVNFESQSLRPISVQNKYRLGQVFTSNGDNRFIYLAYNSSVGNLVMQKNGYCNVGWAYNSYDKAQGAKTFFYNNKYEGTDVDASIFANKYENVRSYKYVWTPAIDKNTSAEGCLKMQIVFKDGSTELLSQQLKLNTIKQIFDYGQLESEAKARVGYIKVEIEEYLPSSDYVSEYYLVRYDAETGDMTYFKDVDGVKTQVNGIYIVGANEVKIFVDAYDAERAGYFKNGNGLVVTDEYADMLGFKYNGASMNINNAISIENYVGKNNKSLSLALKKKGDGTNNSILSSPNHDFDDEYELENNGTITLDTNFVPEKYNLNFGYTIDGESKNTKTGINKSSIYYPNGESLGGYQDVLVKTEYVLCVESLPNNSALPTSIQSLFGEDYNTLTAKGKFTGWLIDKSVLIDLGYVQKPGETGLTDKWYLQGQYVNNVWSYKAWIKFDCTGEFSTLNGKRTLLDGVTNIYGFGDFATVDSWTDDSVGYAGAYKMPIIASWERSHDVEITNTQSYRLDKDDNSRLVQGVLSYAIGASSFVDSIKLNLNSATDVNFVYTDGRTNSAFMQASGMSVITTYGYNLFKYGYDISGYEISFRYSNQIYYAYLKAGNSTNWQAINSPQSVMVSAGDLQKTSLQELIKAVNNWTQGDYVLASTTLNIVPIWRAATIQLTGNKQFEGGSLKVVYGGQYKIERGECATVGMSIAYYTTKSGSVVAADDGKLGSVAWGYLDIPAGNFEFKNGVYNLAITKYEVDNVYKLLLKNFSGALGGEYDTEIKTEAPNVALSTSGGVEYYTYQSLIGTAYNKSDIIEKYTKELFDNVGAFKDVTADDRDDYTESGLRTVYNVDGETYIFVANNHSIGNLVFSREYFDHVAWMFNGQNGRFAFVTSEYKANVHDELLSGKTIKKYNDSNAENKVWTLDMDSDSSDTTSLVLYAIYYRPTYKLNINTINTAISTNKQDFVGYAIVVVQDNATDATGFDLATGTYIVKYAENSMVIYRINNTGDTTDLFKLSSLDLSKFDAIDYIKLHGGCEISIMVVDQGSVEDMALGNSYYDAMIGYKFGNNIICTINGVTQNVRSDKDAYGYAIDFNTNTFEAGKSTLAGLLKEDNVELESGDEIVVNLLFEPISYSIDIGMTNADAGEMHITNKAGEQVKTKNLYTLADIKRDNSFDIYYYAYAGYGLANDSFVVEGQSLQQYDDANATKADQTYKFVLSGAWLRLYYYKNGPYTTAAQDLGDLLANIVLLNFNVKYMAFNDATATDNGAENAAQNALNYNDGNYNSVMDGWQLGKGLTWTLTEAYANDAQGNFATYYYNFDGTMYAILSSWARQPKSISNRSMFASKYDFLLTSKPVENYTISSDNLFNMVDTDKGVIVPSAKRVVYLAMKVMPIYKIEMQIGAYANDTNCTERSFTIVNNGAKNSVSLAAAPNSLVADGEYGKYFGSTTFIYTYYGLQNTISSIYNDKYYTKVSFANLTNDTDLTSPFTTDKDIVVEAIFAPKQLKVNLSFAHNGEAITTEEAMSYLVGWQMPVARGELNNIENAPQDGYVVSNDSIEFIYTIDDYRRVLISVNGDGERVDALNKIYITNEDYELGQINIVVNVEDKQKGLIILKVVGDNSNGTTFYNADLTTMQTFADLYINSINNGKSGIFVEGYPVAIQFNDIPASYRYMGLKKDNGTINANYVVKEEGQSRYILITNGVQPAGESEDDFVTSIQGTYYLVFQKVVAKTEMTLTADNKNNYSYRTANQQAVWDYSKLVLAKGVSVNDTITLSRIKNLENEELDYYYYIDKYGRENQISGSELVVTTALLNSLDGNFEDNAKTLKLGVKSKLKYFVTINIDAANAECLQSLTINGDACNKVDDLTFTSKYYYANSTLTLKVNSINKDKYSIKVSGDYSFSGDQINNDFNLFGDVKLTISITKKSFGLSVEEKLFDDIVELNTNNPQTLTGENLINKNSNNNSTLDGTQFVYQNEAKVDIKQADGDGDNKKLLTQLLFGDENLSIQFNIDWNSEDVSSCFVVKNSAGEQLTTGVSASRDTSNNNKITLTVVIDNVVYSYSLELLSSNKVQFTFVGVGNCNLTLIYTSIKLITVS